MMNTKRNRREALAGITVIASLAATKGMAAASKEDKTISAAFHIDALARENSATDGSWLQFFDNNTMFSGLYEIPAGGEDRQSPHEYDELYFVTKGKAVLTADTETYPASAGSVFFVKAGAPHKFVKIEEDLQVLVFFSKATPN